jgi:hypothetical protein
MSSNSQHQTEVIGVDTRFARKSTASTEPSAEQVAHLLDVLAAGDVQATINGLEAVLARLRPALAAREELLYRVSPKTLMAALELRARTGPR